MSSPGERIGQRYECLRELGTGGTAVVYEAQDHVLSRRCAVKILLDDAGPGGDARSVRLRQEAAALATLDHARVVRVYDLGEHDGRPFLAMEFVPGGSLADRLLSTGPLAPSEAVDRMLEVLEALDAAHQAGIVHRDVKPHNVLLREDGTAALADFGIARHESVSHTRTGVALGSVDYMAPEQRVDARRAGPAADIYGVGCTLYHLLSGETPVDLYLAPDHSPRWEAVPRPLRPVLHQATAVDPSDRYPTAVAMAQDLLALRSQLAALPAWRFQPQGTPAPVPTRTDGAEGAHGAEGTVSKRATGRVAVVRPEERTGLGAEEWRWGADGGPKAGRGSVRFGLAAVAVLVLLLVFGWPLLEARLEAAKGRRAAPQVEPAELVGAWRGSFGPQHHPGDLRLALQGEGAELEASGRLVLDLDGNGFVGELVGSYAAKRGELRLEGQSGELRCRVDSFGVCTGTLRWGSEAVDFALVHVGP